MEFASRTFGSALRFVVLILACMPSISLTQLAAGREWTDATGKFCVEAELVSIESGTVTLRKPDGLLIAVPQEKLGAADQEYLKTHKESGSVQSTGTTSNKRPASVPVGKTKAG